MFPSRVAVLPLFSTVFFFSFPYSFSLRILSEFVKGLLCSLTSSVGHVASRYTGMAGRVSCGWPYDFPLCRFIQKAWRHLPHPVCIPEEVLRHVVSYLL